jgi:hypothetical protein
VSPPFSSLHGSAPVTITVPANTTSSQRTGYVNISDGSIVQTVRVDQATGFGIGISLSNIGFESGLAGWSPFGATASSASNAQTHTGFGSVAEVGGGGGVSQDISGLVPGQFYRLTVYAFVAAGSTAQGLLYVHDTTGAGAVVDGSRTPTPGLWQQFAVNYLATSTGAARIHLIDAGGSGTLYWDDVQVQLGWQNGFETGVIGPGTAFGATSNTVVGGIANSGSFSLRQSGGAGGVYYDVSGLVPGQVYRVAARALSAAVGTSAMLYVHDTTGGNSLVDGPRVPSSSIWDDFEVSFQATATGAVRIHLFDVGGSGTVYWDDIGVVQGFASGFETGVLAPWTPFGTTTLAVNNSLTRTGTHSLSESGASGGVFTDISGLENGQFYHITAFARSGPASTAAVGLYIHDTVGGNSVIDGVRVPLSSSWNLFSLNFAADTTLRARIHLLYSGGTGQVSWDDVQLLPGAVFDFENARLDGWNAFGSAVSTLTTAVANSGSISLQETGGTGGVYNDISGLLPGELYRISARGRSAPGTSSQAILWVHDTTSVNATAGPLVTPSSTSWDSYGTNFVATNTGKVRVHLQSIGGSGTIYWDDVQLTKLSGGTR